MANIIYDGRHTRVVLVPQEGKAVDAPMTETTQLIAGGAARSSMRAMSGLEFLRGLMDGSMPAPPFSTTSRITPAELEVGRVVFEGVPHGDFYNPMGTVHGGWIATLIDTAMACAVHSSLKAGEIFTTVEMNITYVRPVQAATGRLRCEGVLLHSGGRVASAEGKVYDAAGNLIAHGSETCLITRAHRT
jgi:uncharacterized protein (TIGR00369 family)